MNNLGCCCLTVHDSMREALVSDNEADLIGNRTLTLEL